MADALEVFVRLPRGGSDDTVRAGQRLAREMGQELLREADRFSRGPYSLRTLRAMGHPYRRGGRGIPPNERINVQSGRFRSAWRLVTRREADGIRFTLTNEAPYADFLFGGTRRMIRRPLPERLAEFFDRRVATVLRGLLRR